MTRRPSLSTFSKYGWLKKVVCTVPEPSLNHTVRSAIRRNLALLAEAFVMEPQTVTAIPGTSFAIGVTTERSSYLQGAVQSASSTVEIPSRSSNCVRFGPTPLANRIGKSHKGRPAFH